MDRENYRVEDMTHPYIFFRQGMFYPLLLVDDEDARENAECNPGTIRVECALTGKTVWPQEPPMTKYAIIFDMDGTLANTEHRKHHLEARPKNWDGWNSAMQDDTPMDDIVQLANEFAGLGYYILVCTGRQERDRDATFAWLVRHAVRFSKIYMRATDDFRDDAIVKSELLDTILADGYVPRFVIDDRDKVVAMWRARGLTCLQCAPGDF